MKVAFIPVRGGSKSIPLKNIRSFCEKPLVYWAVNAACACRTIDKVYVATDSEKIRGTLEELVQSGDIVNPQKLSVIERSQETATDTASTESAMQEFAERYVFDDIVLIQATSPLLTVADLDRGFAVYGEKGADSVLSVVRQKRFCWKCDEMGIATPINYDVFRRPRRQEFEGYLVENGAFYITSRERLLQTGNRISGRIKVVEMGEESYFEIDEPSDWIIAEGLMRLRSRQAENSCLKGIRMLLTDCDGCLTDAGMYYTEMGDELKKFCARDGMGFGIAKEHGILTGIITGEDRMLNRRRADKLKVDELVENCKDKAAAIRELCAKYGILPEQVAYIGDDINDLSAFAVAGVCFCPADAMPCVKEAADHILQAKGGEGVFREVVEMLLQERER